METSLERLAERLQYLEDLESIRHTCRDYCMRLDSGDLEALGDIFTEDAVVEMCNFDSFMPGLGGEYHGRKSIIDDLYQRGASASFDSPGTIFTTGHINTNMQIDLKGDEATTLAYWLQELSMGPAATNAQMMFGTYQHRLRREEDRWRFSFLRVSVRYRALIDASDVGGESLNDILARPF